MKSHTFVLGKNDFADQKDIEVDLLKLVDTRMLVQANSGGGKSWLLRRLAEAADKQIQTIILDPEGEFVTLREVCDVRALRLIVDVGSGAKLDDKLFG